MADLPLQSVVTTHPFPTSWGVVREPSNPVIPVNATETGEQYVPSPIQLGDGTIWVYVKGHSAIYAYKSVDGGVTFAIQNAGSPVVSAGGGGAWDVTGCVDPHAVYDQANATIHLYYKGYSGAVYQVGHATAADSNPASFTKDAGNPILTNASVSTTLGGATVGDLSVSSVIKIGSTWHFYGYVLYNGVFSLAHWTGSAWNNPSGTVLLLSAPATWQSVVQCPTVFTYGSLYGMIYTIGGDQLGSSPARSQFVGASADGSAWKFNSSTLLAAGPFGASSWEIVENFCGQILKSSTSPFAAPITDANGRWHLYYAGYDNAAHAQSGLAYLTPL